MAFWDRHWGVELDQLGTTEQYAISDVKSECECNNVEAYLRLFESSWMRLFCCRIHFGVMPRS